MKMTNPHDDEYEEEWEEEDDEYDEEYVHVEDDGPSRTDTLDEINQIIRPMNRSQRERNIPVLKIPIKGETWRNNLNKKVYTVELVEQVVSIQAPMDNIIVVLTNINTINDDLHSESIRVSLRDFQEWEKYTESEKASNALPQPGETWQNIHTGLKSTINSVVKSHQGMEVHSTKEKDGKVSHTNIHVFVANHKRIKGSSQWFVGVLNFDK